MAHSKGVGRAIPWLGKCEADVLAQVVDDYLRTSRTQLREGKERLIEGDEGGVPVGLVTILVHLRPCNFVARTTEDRGMRSTLLTRGELTRLTATEVHEINLHNPFDRMHQCKCSSTHILSCV